MQEVSETYLGTLPILEALISVEIVRRVFLPCVRRCNCGKRLPFSPKFEVSLPVFSYIIIAPIIAHSLDPYCNSFSLTCT